MVSCWFSLKPSTDTGWCGHQTHGRLGGGLLLVVARHGGRRMMSTCFKGLKDVETTKQIFKIQELYIYIHRVHPGLGLVWETSWKKHIRIWDSRPVASDFAGSVRWGMKISTSDWDFCWFSSYVHSPRGKWLQAAWEYPLKLWSNGDDGGRGDPKIPFGNFNLRSQPHV